MQKVIRKIRIYTCPVCGREVSRSHKKPCCKQAQRVKDEMDKMDIDVKPDHSRSYLGIPQVEYV